MAFPIPADLPPNTECELMLQLADADELFARIAAHTGTELSLQKQLRTDYPAELVAAAISLTELRRKGGGKFTLADRMWFDRQGLEQSTSELVSRHKAQRFSGEVDDLCCGIGGDAVALAERGAVHAVDLNPAACLRTFWNASVYGVPDSVHVECADVHARLQGTRHVHIDPDRRAASSRKAVRIEDGQPGLEFLRNLISARPGGAIKLSPAANFTGKFPQAEIELISLSGECKEATIWFGDLGEPGIWRATALPSGETLAGSPLEAWSDLSPPLRYVYDPDPAIVRAGLIDMLASDKRLLRLDEAEEYLTSDQLIDSPFVRAFEVVERIPYTDKPLRAWFRSSRVGQLEIKCRHIPVNVDKLRQKLTLPGTEAAVLIVARVGGKSEALVCRRVS